MKELHIKGKRKLTTAELRKLASDVCDFCTIDDMTVMAFVSVGKNNFTKELEKYTADEKDSYTVIRQPRKDYVVIIYPVETLTDEATPLIEGGAYFYNTEPTEFQIEAARSVLRERIEKIL